MFQVNCDPKRNRLYITLAGHMEQEERHAAVKAVLQEAGKLRPGFDVVTDISDLHATNKEGFKDFLRAKSALKLKGIGHILRVVKLPLSRIQIERISEEAGYHEGHVDSVETADLHLDALRSEAGIMGLHREVDA